jgi:hypothetical protein
MPRRWSLLLRTITTAIAVTAATTSNPIHVSVTPDSLTGLPNNFLLRGRQILQGMPVRRFRTRIAFLRIPGIMATFFELRSSRLAPR